LREPPLRVAAQPVNVDQLDRASVGLAMLVHSTTSARLAQIDPIGGFVTSAAKPRFDQRLQKQRAKAEGVFLSPANVAVNLQTISSLPPKLVATTFVYSETSRIDFCTQSHPLL